MFDKKQNGVTLIELTVVLLILVALAGLVSPYVGGTGQKAMCEATDVSMQNIKKVIMENYYVDTLGKYPKKPNDGTICTTDTCYNLTCLFEKCGWNDFDPVTNVGFRKGGYVQNGLQLSATDVDQLSNTFKNDTNGIYVNDYIKTNDTVILDAWGNPIVIQKINNNFRLLSAGFNNTIDTLLSDAIHKDDDRVLYLNIPTPAGEQNTPCEQY